MRLRSIKSTFKPQIVVQLCLQTRTFHQSSITLKNPYYFYDLAARQPRALKSHTFDPINTNLGHEHLDALQRARLVFGVRGSRDASRNDSDKNAQTVAGIRIPGRPDEPNNCCMSGCVNCVWEMYKDDMTEYRTKKKEAYSALMAKPELKWPEGLFGPEPKSRIALRSSSESGSELSNTSQAALNRDNKKGLEEIDQDMPEEDLDVNIKQFLMIEERIRNKKRQEKLAQAAAANASSKQTSEPQSQAGL